MKLKWAVRAYIFLVNLLKCVEETCHMYLGNTIVALTQARI